MDQSSAEATRLLVEAEQQMGDTLFWRMAYLAAGALSVLEILAFAYVLYIGVPWVFRQWDLPYRPMIIDWAVSLGLQITSLERRYVRIPFSIMLGLSSMQATYLVRLRNSAGQESECWIKAGSYFLGARSSKVRVWWIRGGQT